MTKYVLAVTVSMLALIVYSVFVYTHNFFGVLFTICVYVFLRLLIEFIKDEKDSI